MTSRCTGHCCESFFLSNNYEEYMREYRQLMRGIEIGEFIKEDLSNRDLETLQIAPMLILKQQLLRDAEYTCKHYVDHQCTIYETRPYMCSSYPNRQICEKAECTWHPDDQAKENPQFPEELRPLRLFDDPVDKLKILLARVNTNRRGESYSFRGWVIRPLRTKIDAKLEDEGGPRDAPSEVRAEGDHAHRTHEGLGEVVEGKPVQGRLRGRDRGPRAL